MIAYLIAFATLMDGSILGIHIGQVHHLLNELAGTMSAPIPPEPIMLIKDVANSSGVDYTEMVKLASLVCEHDIGLDLVTQDGCTVIEEIAAHFLASMGMTITAQGSLSRALSRLSYHLHTEQYYYTQHQDVFPLVCTYARNEYFSWRNEVASRIPSARTACDMLDRSVERYIHEFDARKLKNMLSKKCNISHPDIPGVKVTYKQIGMMIPRKCQQMTSIYPQNSVPPVCTLFPEKTLNLLADISYNLQLYPMVDKMTLINWVNSNHEFKVFHARHYIQNACEQAEANGNSGIRPACNLILKEHLEVMVSLVD